jgi:HSP20 family protein
MATRVPDAAAPGFGEEERMTEIAKAEEAREPADLMSRWFPELTWPRWAELRRPEFLSRFESPMRLEEFREGTELVVRAEMPGIDPDKDVELHVSDHTLHIRAERKEEKKTEEKGQYRSEFRYGSFARSMPLPTGATSDDVKATYKDGILEVRIPVDAAKAEATKIPIQHV